MKIIKRGNDTEKYFIQDLWVPQQLLYSTDDAQQNRLLNYKIYKCKQHYSQQRRRYWTKCSVCVLYYPNLNLVGNDLIEMQMFFEISTSYIFTPYCWIAAALKLNPTWWAGWYDAIFALKAGFVDGQNILRTCKADERIISLKKLNLLCYWFSIVKFWPRNSLLI